MSVRRLVLMLAAAAALLGRAEAATYSILVAPRDTPAATAAAAKARPPLVVAERTLQRALDHAVEVLKEPGATVNVLLSEGEFAGKAGSGTWQVAPISNATGALRIAGGYDASFERRDPFGTPSRLVTVAGRGGPFLEFARGSKLRELVVSGLVMDSAPSNRYDSENHSILKGQSRTYPLVSFGLLGTDRLVVADNVFLNGPHGAFDPMITPLTPDAEVDIRNNFFINNIKTLKIGPGIPLRFPIKAIHLRHNSFISNWPYNPDPDSSNVGAVELYHKGSAAQLNIEGNLFALNPGGAFQHDWPENRMPGILMKANLFFKNAGLFGNQNAGAGVIAGKFGPNPKHMVLELSSIEDDFKYRLEGNVVADPGLPIKQLLVVSPGEGEDVKVQGYAPAMEFDPKSAPFPSNPLARGFGVQSSRVYPIH